MPPSCLQSDDVAFRIEPRVSATAVHFVVSGVQRDRALEYVLRVAEPTTAYTIDYLAPFIITIRQQGEKISN